jgi:hypothetical protein
MALSEGYFYLAQLHLGRGDKAKARKYLEESRRQNVIIYTEHTAAAFELKRLGVPTETGSLPPPASAGSPAPSTTKSAGTPSASPPEKKAPRKSAPKSPETWNSDIWKRQ